MNTNVNAGSVSQEAEIKANQINEKLQLQKRTKRWKRLQVYGDVTVLANMLGKSRTAIDKALRKGEGSLELLQAIDRYFSQRSNS